MAFATAPKPNSLLGWHRILSPNAGVKVSPICLGGISIGNSWKFYTGKNEEPFKLLDAFYELGGNFIDTASLYNNEGSEQLIGQWMEERGVRDQMVIATKYSAGYRAYNREQEPIQSNFTGNSAKSMRVSVHWWDYATSVEEVMRGLHAHVMAREVLYLGISNTPAWIVVKANAYARRHGLTPFSVYQGDWNASLRDMEGEVIPMCEDQGMAVVPWGALGTGSLLSAAQRKERESDVDAPKMPVSETALRTSEALERIADRKGTTLQAIALAYLFHQTTYVFPIVGVNTVEHIKAMPEALRIKLTQEEIDEIYEASPYNPGYPMSFTQYMKPVKYDLSWTPADHQQYQMAAWIDAPPKPLNLGTGDLVRLRKTCHYFNEYCDQEILKSATRDMSTSEDGDGENKSHNLYLHRAVERCSHGILESLLELKAPLSLGDRQSETALHWAARKGCDVCVQRLLGAGAVPSITSTTNWTPLMLAARLNHPIVVKLLLDAGADVNQKGFHGWTPLHLAHRFGHTTMYDLLCSVGGDEKALDNDGLNPRQAILKQKGWGVL
ncbi:hypothetical protein FSARC_1831 [Fusarium sarcochroum]|uniref:NADP-dependent oxidoreductase domain-containing protein n=1 Tax=Fusarium sarcochroum TaxID=1208366 RepID=A0A8H4XDP3_9HYPO|nr:hypothetical protein FSARC_1831 [Fusarium sarcochroum]